MDAIFQPIKKSDTYQIKLFKYILHLFNVLKLVTMNVLVLYDYIFS